MEENATHTVVIKAGAHERASRKALAIQKSTMRQAAVIERAEAARRHLPPDVMWQMERLRSQAVAIKKQFDDTAAPMMRNLHEAQRIFTRMSRVAGIQAITEKFRLHDLEMKSLSHASDGLKLGLLDGEFSQVARKMTMLNSSMFARTLSRIDFSSVARHMEVINARKDFMSLGKSLFNMHNSLGVIQKNISESMSQPRISRSLVERFSREMDCSAIGVRSLERGIRLSGFEEGRLEECKEQESGLRGRIRSFCPEALNSFDGVRAALEGSNTDKLRHVAISMRDIINKVIDRSAHTEEFRIWEGPRNRQLKGKDKRRRKLLFICRGLESEYVATFLEEDIRTALLLIERWNGVIHNQSAMTEVEVRILVAKTEGVIGTLIEAASADREDT